jgi:hypothetical protein
VTVLFFPFFWLGLVVLAADVVLVEVVALLQLVLYCQFAAFRMLFDCESGIFGTLFEVSQLRLLA